MRGIGLLIVVGAGLAALAAASTSKAEEKPSGPFPPPPPPPPPPTGKTPFEMCVDPGMPASLVDEARAAFDPAQQKNMRPADFEALAKIFEDGGYPIMAECIAKIGREKSLAAKAELERLGGMPHTIRMGDIPSLMAVYYTGVASRFKELGPLNPQIGALKTVKGVTNYERWIPGTEILIPKSWKPLDKPIPPVATGGKGPTDAQVEEQKVEPLPEYIKPNPEAPEESPGPNWVEKIPSPLV